MNSGEVRYLGAPISMAKIAENRVWMVSIPVNDFEQFKNNYVVIHHMKEGDAIRCRCLSSSAPTTDAKLVKANLEDAYLQLLSDKK